MEIVHPPQWWIVVVVVLLLWQCQVLTAQQSYVNNHQLACYNGAWNSTTKGFLCNGVKPSCQAYVTFRSTQTYNTPVTIAYLLGVQSSATEIASLNGISSDVTTIAVNTMVIVPVNCSCSRTYYQHNASYSLKSKSETYFTVANDTYEALSTCQAIMDQNPYGDRNLSVGLDLIIPLRCACPTSNQTNNGVNYLLTYLVKKGDTISTIADQFKVDEQSVKDANELTGNLIFYFTPILVPLNTKPTKIEYPVASPPPESPPQISIRDSDSNSSSSKKWVYVGIGIGAAAVLIILSGFLMWFYRKKRADNAKLVYGSVPPPKTVSGYTDYASIPESVSLSSEGLRYAIESLTHYKFEDLEMATGNFGENTRIEGCVYRGFFKGDVAAVKVMKGDVSNEINLLKMINHLNIVRLSGFCVHDGNTYLVYEYAENGSLTNCLHFKNHLSWKQRVQIAYDVADALNYLHNFTNPPYIHKSLTTGNILLDGNFRAKLTNFGWARMVEENEGLQLTNHVVGTFGYLAPEYLENGVISPKLDVFAFGVVMLELLSGKEATGDVLLSAAIVDVLGGENVREKLRDFIDGSMGRDYPLDLAFSFAQLAKLCVTKDLNSRPAMLEVVITLSKILSSSLDWDPSVELDNSNSMMSFGNGR
jgi:serine/threonine protein kinase/LysM repeat protein